MTIPADTAHREDGFTLVELLVGITISLIVLLATLTSLDAFSASTAHQTRVTDANEQVRSVMDKTVTDLRRASLILNAGATDLSYSVPVSSTSARIERLCVAGGELYGSSTVTSGALAAPAAACENGTKIATLKSTASTAFTYDGAASSATPALVKNVGLTFSFYNEHGGRTATSTLQASAARRSAGTLPITPGEIVPECNEGGALLSLAASVDDLGPLSVTYADDGGVEIGTPVTGGVQIPEGITRVVATITDAAGVTNTITKDLECT